MPSSDRELLDLVATVARRQLPDVPDIGKALADRIMERLPALEGIDAYDLVLASCSANFLAIADAMVREVPVSEIEPTAESLRTVRGLAQRELAWEDVMTGYRIAIGHLCELWAETVAREQPRRAIEVTAAGTAFLLEWMERVFGTLGTEYRAEAERLARERALAQVDETRRALSDAQLDVRRAGLRLGYDLTGDHVALVVRTTAPDGRAGSVLDDALSALARAGRARPLTVRVDVRTAWCWTRPGAAASPALTGVLVGRGAPGRGLDGFRRSHAEALEALRVAELAGRRDGTARYETEELAALCSHDVDDSRRFVAATLGALAAEDDLAARLRATLEAYLGEGCSFRAAGARLGVHHNTVRYRVAQAEALLGRPVRDRRLALEVALHLIRRLGDGVRRPATGAAC